MRMVSLKAGHGTVAGMTPTSLRGYPQSVGQLTVVSPLLQTLSPQYGMDLQSEGQLELVSPDWQIPSPQCGMDPQSEGQLELVSPDWQIPSPQQSGGCWRKVEEDAGEASFVTFPAVRANAQMFEEATPSSRDALHENATAARQAIQVGAIFLERVTGSSGYGGMIHFQSTLVEPIVREQMRTARSKH